MSSTENPWRQLKRETRYDNPWITLFHDDVIRPDGRPGIYGVVHFKNRAVGVLAVDDQDRVLMVGQFRYTTNHYSWEIPEGGAPENEDPEETARRELREETGYSAAAMRLVLRTHLSNSVSDEEAFLFQAEGLQPGAAEPEGTEQLSVKWIDFKTAFAMIAKGEVTDSLTIMALQHLALQRPMP